MLPTIALQIIHTTWTKASRGGRGAQLRNAVPLAFPIAAEAGKSVSQIHRFGESNDFCAPIPPLPKAEKDAVRETNDSFSYKWAEISCEWNSENQTFHLLWIDERGGAPRVKFHDEFGNQKALRHNMLIAPDSWIRVRWMRRFSCIDTGQWWYERIVVNAAYFQGVIDPNVFLQSQPIAEFASLPMLR